MIIAAGTQFHVFLPWCLLKHSVLNVKEIVGAFNQEKALVGASSMIVKTDCGTDPPWRCRVHPPRRGRCRAAAW